MDTETEKPDEEKPASRFNIENEPVWTRKTAVRTTAFRQLVFVMCVIYLVGAGSNFHLFPFMTDQGLPPNMAVLVITVLSVCAALGGVLFGFLAERISVKKLMGGVLITIGIIFYLVFWAVKEPVWMFIFAVVYGTIRGGVLPLIFLLWTEFYGRRSSGTVLGIAGPFGWRPTQPVPSQRRSVLTFSITTGFPFQSSAFSSSWPDFCAWSQNLPSIRN